MWTEIKIRAFISIHLRGHSMWWAKNALRSCCGCAEGWDQVQKLPSKDDGCVKLTVWMTQVWSNSKETKCSPPCPRSFSYSRQHLASSSYLCWKFLKGFLLEKGPDLLFYLHTHFSIWLWLVVTCFPNQIACLSPLRTTPNAKLQTVYSLPLSRPDMVWNRDHQSAAFTEDLKCLFEEIHLTSQRRRLPITFYIMSSSPKNRFWHCSLKLTSSGIK